MRPTRRARGPRRSKVPPHQLPVHSPIAPGRSRVLDIWRASGLVWRPGRPSGLILSPDGRLKTSPDGRPGLCQHPDLFCRERKQVRMAAGRHPDLFCVDPRFGVKSRHSSEQVRMAARVSVSIRTCFAVNENKSGWPPVGIRTCFASTRDLVSSLVILRNKSGWPPGPM